MFRFDEFLALPEAEVQKPAQTSSIERRVRGRFTESVKPGFVAVVFRGTVEEARAKARYIINERSHDGYVRAIQDWKPLDDGRVEFTICRVRI